MLNVGLTGATGLLGSQLVDRLILNENYKITLINRTNHPFSTKIESGVSKLVCDLENEYSCIEKIKNLDIIIHLAGLPEGWAYDNEAFLKSNYCATKNLLQAISNNNIKKLIYISTINVFSVSQGQILNEYSPIGVPYCSDYCKSKLNAEILVRAQQEKGLEVITLYPAAIFGPGPNRKGINLFIKRYVQRSIPLVPSGTLPLVFIDDLSNVILKIIERQNFGRKYVICGDTLSTKDFCRLISNILNQKTVPPIVSNKLVNVFSIVSETVSKFTKEYPLISINDLRFLNWGPIPDSTSFKNDFDFKFTSIEEGLRKTIAYLKLYL